MLKDWRLSQAGGLMGARVWSRLVLLLLVFCSRGSAASDFPSREPLSFDPRFGVYLREQGFSQAAVIVAASGTARAPLEGDAVAAWVSTVEGGQTKQWLLIIRRRAAERSKALQDQQIYLSWGPVISFSSQPELIELELLGPLSGPPTESPTQVLAWASKRERVEFPGDYLRLGFVDRVRVGRKIARVEKAHPGLSSWHLYGQSKPVKAAALKEAQPIAALMAFDAGEERAFAGCGVVLQALMRLGLETPGLKDICQRVVHRPSLIQMAKMLSGGLSRIHFGSGSDFHGIAAVEGDLTHAYRVPIEISFERELLLRLSMELVEPRPPLDLCAGVVGCLAVHPKDPGQTVRFQVIGARSGPEN